MFDFPLFLQIIIHSGHKKNVSSKIIGVYLEKSTDNLNDILEKFSICFKEQHEKITYRSIDYN